MLSLWWFYGGFMGFMVILCWFYGGFHAGFMVIQWELVGISWEVHVRPTQASGT